MDKPIASLVIPVYNNFKSVGNQVGFEDCLTSTIETCNQNIEIIIVDNGSDKEISEFVLNKSKEDNRIIYLRYDEPLGYPKATNNGIKLATADYILLVNSDVKWLGTDWLQRLLQPFDNPRVGITGCLTNTHHGLNEEFLIFFCVALRRTMIDEIGLLDESFAPGAGEDIDLCIRAKDYGWEICNVTKQVWSPENNFYVSDFPLYHLGEATVHTLDNWEDSFNSNMEKVRLKNFHRTIPGWFDYANVYDRMVQEFDTGAHFVEVGSWFGRSACFMARRILDSGKSITFDAVDWWNHPGHEQEHFDIIRERGGSQHSAFHSFMKEAGVGGHVNMIKSDSVSAAALYDNESIDFLWLDADHSYEGIMADLHAWYPKIKTGAYIGGHDYLEEGKHMPILAAVNQFFSTTYHRCFTPPSSWLIKK